MQISMKFLNKVGQPSNHVSSLAGLKNYHVLTPKDKPINDTFEFLLKEECRNVLMSLTPELYMSMLYLNTSVYFARPNFSTWTNLAKTWTWICFFYNFIQLAWRHTITVFKDEGRGVEEERGETMRYHGETFIKDYNSFKKYTT